jgi:EAL domain-containing protein (putative c-di-GMP-specific phosphodiesterase class I)
VRVSRPQLLHGEFADQIATAIREEGVSPEQLILGIAEHALTDEGDAVVTALQRVQALGVRICLDGFGTARSSIRQLHLVRISAISIDAALLRRERESTSIVESTLALARSVGADVVARAVTTPQQARWLKQMGCEYATGLLFGEALTVARAERLLLDTTLRSAAIAGAAAVEHSVSIH